MKKPSRIVEGFCFSKEDKSPEFFLGKSYGN